MHDDDRQAFDDKVGRLRGRLSRGAPELPEAPDPLKPPEKKKPAPPPDPPDTGTETAAVEEVEPPTWEEEPPLPPEEDTGEWYYEDFMHRYPPDDRPEGKFGILVNAAAVKRTFWDELQREILPIVQQWIDDGWQPVSEIGPSALEIDDKQQSAIGKQIWAKHQRKVYLTGIKVRMRKKGRRSADV